MKNPGKSAKKRTMPHAKPLKKRGHTDAPAAAWGDPSKGSTEQRWPEDLGPNLSPSTALSSVYGYAREAGAELPPGKRPAVGTNFPAYSPDAGGARAYFLNSRTPAAPNGLVNIPEGYFGPTRYLQDIVEHEFAHAKDALGEAPAVPHGPSFRKAEIPQHAQVSLQAIYGGKDYTGADEYPDEMRDLGGYTPSAWVSGENVPSQGIRRVTDIPAGEAGAKEQRRRFNLHPFPARNFVRAS